MAKIKYFKKIIRYKSTRARSTRENVGLEEMKAVVVILMFFGGLVLGTSAEDTQWEEPEYLEEEPKMRFLEITDTPSEIRQWGVPPNPVSYVPPLVPGISPPAGNYYPPVLPYRFPSYPYDNPSYSPYATMLFVPLPPPWRSDALNILSDGGRYIQDMAHYETFHGGHNAGASSGSST